MQVLSLVWGILAICGMFVAFFPSLRSLNLVTVPFSFVGLIISIVALVSTKEAKKDMSIAGTICCVIAMGFGLLITGCG